LHELIDPGLSFISTRQSLLPLMLAKCLRTCISWLASQLWTTHW